MYGPQRPCCLPLVPPKLGRGLPCASCVLPWPPYQQAATGLMPSSLEPSAPGTGPLDPGTAPKATPSVTPSRHTNKWLSGCPPG